MNNQNKHWHLYVLKLEQGKYYVGITTQTVEQRFANHVKHVRSAYWTQKYKPVAIISAETRDLGYTTKEQAEAEENKLTRQYMKTYGLNNVRGGDLTGLELYVKRFGYIFDADGWGAITTIIFVLLVIAVLGWQLHTS